METFKMNVGRTLNAFTDGTYTVEQALYEFIDNSEAASATNVLIQAITDQGDNLEKIVVADNGTGMSRQALKDSLEFAGEIRERHKFEVSEYGVGMKAAAHSLATSWTVVTRDNSGQVSGAILDFNQIAKDQKYIGPFTESGQDIYQQLWNEYSLDKHATGTINILAELKQTQYNSATNFIGHTGAGIRHHRRISRRYYDVIDSGRLSIYTCKNGESRKILESSDPLRRLEGETEVLLEQSLYHAKTGTRFNVTITRMPEDARTADFGVYFKVAGIVICNESDTIAGLYKSKTSHSHRWRLRMEMDFADKEEFYKVAEFAAHKHDLKIKDSSFSDWLRDSPVGKIWREETEFRSEQAKAAKLKKLENKFQEDNKQWINTLNSGKQVYGLAIPYAKYAGTFRDIKPGTFDTRREMSRLEDGVILYNETNPTVMRCKKSGEYKCLRALVTQNALSLK